MAGKKGRSGRRRGPPTITVRVPVALAEQIKNLVEEFKEASKKTPLTPHS